MTDSVKMETVNAISLPVMAPGMAFLATKYMYSSASEAEASSFPPSRESESAIFCVPGLY